MEITLGYGEDLSLALEWRFIVYKIVGGLKPNLQG